MILMNYFCGGVLVFLALSVMALSVVILPHQGVLALMGVSFFCCIFMVVLGRTFMALVMYIVYLGGLIVVFGYCVSVEKGAGGVFKVGLGKCFIVVVLFVILWWFLGGLGGSLIYTNWEDLVCMEVNGGSVLYFKGGAGLFMCSWALLVVLFSILVILGWSRRGGLRSF